MRTDFTIFSPTHTVCIYGYIRFIYTEQGRPGRITTDLKRPVYTRDYIFYTIIIIFYRVQGAADTQSRSWFIRNRCAHARLSNLSRSSLPK